jgi:hypothetical protein
MNILQKSLAILNPRSKNRSFEQGLQSFGTGGGCNSCGDCNDCDWRGYTSKLNNAPIFNQKDKQIHKYADHPIFAVNCQFVSNQVAHSPFYINPLLQRASISGQITQSFEAIGLTTQFIEEVVKSVYSECGISLITFNSEKKLIIIPFLSNGQEQVKIEYFPYSYTIKSIGILDTQNYSGGYNFIDTNSTPYYIIYNIKNGNSYSSNLTLASPYIALSNELLTKDLLLAKNNNTVEAFVSPKLQSLVKSDKGVVLTTGDSQSSMIQYLSGQWKALVRQLENAVKKPGIKFLPFDVDVKNLTLSNSQNQTDLLRKDCDEKIQIACFSNGSMSGRDNVANRSVSETDRDSFEERTIKYFQNKIERMVNDFVLPLVLPISHEYYQFTYKDVETEETLKLREQQTKILEVISTPNFKQLLLDNKLKVNTDDLKVTFNNLYGINLIDYDESNAETSNPTNGNNLAPSDNASTTVRGITQLDTVYSEFYKLTNMSYSELLNWYNNPKSRIAGLDDEPIKRTLELLNTNKSNWNKRLVTNAQKTITNIKNVLKSKAGNYVKVGGQSIGLTKRDLLLKNLGYNPIKLTRSLVYNNIQLRIMEFGEVENSSNQNKIINVFRKGLKEQYKDIQIKGYNNTLGLETYISRDKFKEQLDYFVLNTIKEYNKEYDTIYGEPGIAVKNLVRDAVKLTYDGGSINTIVDGKLEVGTYAGYDKSNAARFEKIQDLTKEETNQVLEASLVRFNQSLFGPLYRQIIDILARQTGKRYKGFFDTGDDKVRTHHHNNSGFYVLIGSELPDNTNPNFDQEINCRCRIVYGTKQDMEQLKLKFYAN